jgi:hypothetical protein
VSEQTTVEVRLLEGAQREIEDDLRQTWLAAASSAVTPEGIAAVAGRALGNRCWVTVEAERGRWSRYRVSVRVGGQTVTIATVELTLPG